MRNAHVHLFGLVGVGILFNVAPVRAQVVFTPADLLPAGDAAWTTNDLGLTGTWTVEILLEATPWATFNSALFDTQQDGFPGGAGSTTNDVVIFIPADAVGATASVLIPANANLALFNDADDGSGSKGTGPNGILDPIDSYLNSDPAFDFTGLSPSQFIKYFPADPSLSYQFDTVGGQSHFLGSGFFAFILIDDDHTGPNFDFNDMIIGLVGHCLSDLDCDDGDPCTGEEVCGSDHECIVQIGITDCNGNGRDDTCDISDGTSDDCNLNGVPDECDIADGTSLDVSPADGVPDECVDPDVAGGDWTDDIWGLSGLNPFPDNVDGVDSLSVTIDRASVFLDDTVEIQTLRLLNGGTLDVTQLDQGDFTTVAAGGIFNEGNLQVANNRRVDIAGGPLTIGPGGRYGPVLNATGAGCPDGAVCAVLTANGVTVSAGDCDALRNGGELHLDEAMTAQIFGDVSLVGLASFGCPATGGAASLLGINVPPKLIITGPGGTSLTGTFSLEGVIGSSNVSFLTRSSGGSERGSAIRGMVLGGDFDNRSIAPTLFHWTRGVLTLTGAIQTVEVAGLDIGPIPEGFLTSRDTLFDSGEHENFSIGLVEVAGGTDVTFDNTFANTAGVGACEEALYVEHLVLGAGSTIHLNDCKVYYETLEDLGATVETIGCGGLVGLCDPQTPATDNVAKNRFITVFAGAPGRRQAVRVTFEALPPPFDVLNGTRMWVGAPFEVSDIGATVEPVPGFATFLAAPLQCTPFYADWSAFGPVEVFNEAIVPGGSYPVQVIDESCGAGAGEESFSTPLSMVMARWGDVAGDCTQLPCSAPNGVVDIFDAIVILNKFGVTPGAVRKVRADLEPAIPDFIINISDALSVLDGFTGQPYPFAPPSSPCGG